MSWVRSYLSANPDSTVVEVEKAALKAGLRIDLPTVSAMRRALFQNAELSPAPSAPAALTSPKPKSCGICGQNGHWPSECSEWERQTEVPEYAPDPEPVIALTESDIMPEPKPTPAPVLLTEVAEKKPEPPKPAPQKAVVPESRRRTVIGRMMRRQRLNVLLEEDPGAEPMVLMGKIKEEFGMGLDWRYVYETCRVSREIHGLPQVPDVKPHTRAPGEVRPLPTYGLPFVDPEDDEFADTPEEEIRWLAEQIADIMRAHSLTEVRLEAAHGKVKWRYSIVKTAEGEVSI